MTDGISQGFEVAAPVDRAFSVWTTKAGIWWPRGHTMGGDDHDRADATQVEVTFAPTDGGTRVTIEQTGFERLGDAGRARRERTDQAWSHLTELYRAAL